MSRTLEQKRAKYALDVVNSKRLEASDYKKKYTTFVRQAPAMILNNGLGQALAFLLSKEETAAKDFYDELKDWLCGVKDDDHPVRVYTTNGDFIEQIMSGDRRKYNQAQAEALSLLNWMTKFVAAYLKEEA